MKMKNQKIRKKKKRLFGPTTDDVVRDTKYTHSSSVSE